MNDLSYRVELLNILRIFDDFCKHKGIKYLLGYGTLLGAIRHKGFIPWDDDIDVVLTTKEYYKIKKLANKNSYLDSNCRYRIMLPGEDDFCYSYIKIVDTKYTVREKNIAEKYRIGLFIDVFRVDYWPESSIKEFYQLRKARFLLKINEILIRGNVDPNSKYACIDNLLRPVDLLLKVLNIKSTDLCIKLENIGARNKKSKYMGNIMSGSGRKSERLSADIFDEITFHEFEGSSYPVPKMYDAYLKSIYGDYLKIPDVSKQIGHQYEIFEQDGKE